MYIYIYIFFFYRLIKAHCELHLRSTPGKGGVQQWLTNSNKLERPGQAASAFSSLRLMASILWGALAAGGWGGGCSARFSRQYA